MTNWNPTPEQARERGQAHKVYGWASNPRHYWTEEARKAYMQGYEEARYEP